MASCYKGRCGGHKALYLENSCVNSVELNFKKTLSLNDDIGMKLMRITGRYL